MPSQQFYAFLFQPALSTQAFHFRINVPDSKGFPKAYMATKGVTLPSMAGRNLHRTMEGIKQRHQSPVRARGRQRRSKSQQSLCQI